MSFGDVKLFCVGIYFFSRMLLEGPPWFLSAWGHSSKNVTNSGSPEHPPAHRVGAVTPLPPGL